jgi:CubicO group peptidase (beta-lactamase class C family)
MSRRILLAGGAALATGVLLPESATAAPSPSSPPASGGPSPSPSGSGLAAAPTSVAAPILTDAQVRTAIDGLDSLVATTMQRTGIPGMAVAVVYKDQVPYLKGFGIRRVGSPDKVDTNTVFQLASLSKPVASTVVAGLVGDDVVAWDGATVKYDPTFALHNAYVTDNASLADLFSHRSGLPDHFGDLLESLGYDRTYILEHLRAAPLGPFRISYAYTNFGLTAAAVAAAKAAGKSWEDVSQTRLYTPAGMTSTSSRFADFEAAKNRVYTHVRSGSQWAPTFVRDPDAQTPAGGASSTIADMSRFVRLQLANGELDGKRIIDETALSATHTPQVISNPPRQPNARPGFYGLGWNVSFDAYGRLSLSHSGAFELGAATAVNLWPTEQLGIVALTNAAPIGAAETITATFLDVAQHGHPTIDWVPLLTKAFEDISNEGRSDTDYAHPPAGAKAAQAPSTYTGTYANSFFGPMKVTVTGTKLDMALGPKNMTFALHHFDGDTFFYETTGENATGPSGVTFTVSDGHATKVTVEDLNHNGLGTFTR